MNIYNNKIVEFLTNLNSNYKITNLINYKNMYIASI